MTIDLNRAQLIDSHSQIKTGHRLRNRLRNR